MSMEFLYLILVILQCGLMQLFPLLPFVRSSSLQVSTVGNSWRFKLVQNVFHEHLWQFTLSLAVKNLQYKPPCISKTWFSHVDRHSASANIIVYHSYTPNLARCPSASQRSTVLCGCKLMLHSTTETCAITIGCYRGLHFLGSPHRESNYKYARLQ